MVDCPQLENPVHICPAKAMALLSLLGASPYLVARARAGARRFVAWMKLQDSAT